MPSEKNRSALDGSVFLLLVAIDGQDLQNFRTGAAPF